MLNDANIEIYHKQKGADNKVQEVLLYAGACKLWCEKSVREVLGGAENNSEIIVLIPEKLPEIECGDRCVIDGNHIRAVHQCHVLPDYYYMAPLTFMYLR